MRGNEISLEQKGIVVGMRNGGLSYGEIAEKMNLSRSTIAAIFKKYQETGSVDNLPRSGRPKSFQERDKRALKRTLINNRFATLSEISKCLATPVSTKTLLKEIHALGFDSYVAATQKPKPKPKPKRPSTTIRLWTKISK